MLLPYIKVFSENRKRSGTSLIFCMIFEEKSSSCYIALTDQISLSGLPLIREILTNMFVAIVCQPGCDASVFKLTLCF